MNKEILEVLRDSLTMLANNGGLGKTELMERIAGLIEKGSSQQGVMVTGREHELKCWPEPFQNVMSGVKRHEARKNDRDFQVGDTLWLREWEPVRSGNSYLPDHGGEYTGRDVRVGVSYITPGGAFGLPDDMCVMSIAAAPSAQNADKEKSMDAEIYRMQLAAISTIALCNTRESLARNRLTSDSPYWTPAFEDVCKTVEREMAERERAVVAPSAEGVIEPVREQCPDCPDGQVWDNKGPTGETCLTCGGEAFVWKSRSLKSKEGGAG